MAFVKLMDRPMPSQAAELREMPRTKPDNDGLAGFWKRLPADPKPPVRISQPKSTERNYRLAGVGQIRAASFFRDAGKFAGKQRRIKRALDVSYRDFRIRNDRTFGVQVVKQAVQHEQGTLSLIR